MGLTASRELAVLGVLREHPAHGYALAEALEATIGAALGLTRANTYAILNRFTDRGWIRGTRAATASAPDRVVYEVTEAGRTAWAGLVSQAARAEEPAAALVGLLAHLDGIDPQTRDQLLTRLIRDRRDRLEQLEPLLEHPGSFGAGLRLRHRLIGAELDALEKALTALPTPEDMSRTP